METGRSGSDGQVGEPRAGSGTVEGAELAAACRDHPEHAEYNSRSASKPSCGVVARLSTSPQASEVAPPPPKSPGRALHAALNAKANGLSGPQTPGVSFQEAFAPTRGRPKPVSDTPSRRKRRSSSSPSGRNAFEEKAAKKQRRHPSPMRQAAGTDQNDPSSNRAVADHYNARPDQGIEGRKLSPIFKLRAFNNWIKTTLINLCTRGPGASVLDMGCGKGGDLNKWTRVRCGSYIGVDIAEVSISQARERYQAMRGFKPKAHFFVLDCYVNSLLSVLDPSTRFDIVSMQFCMHYSFESEAKARMMLQNVVGGLRPGSRYILTVPDADVLKKRLRSPGIKIYHVDEASNVEDKSEIKRGRFRIHEFGNSIYKVKFKFPADEDTKGGTTADALQKYEPPLLPEFGARYSFTLKDAVDDCDEFVVEPRVFEELAAEYGLQIAFRYNFHEYYDKMTIPGDLVDEKGAWENKLLLERMKVVDRCGSRVSKMSDEEWEAAGLYAVYGFDKL